MKDHREAFIAYVMEEARKWRPECDLCFYTKVTSDIEDDWVRPKKCTCLGLHGLTTEQTQTLQTMIVNLVAYTGKQKAIQFDLECQMRDFERAVNASYGRRDVRLTEIYDWRNFHVYENKQCIVTVWNCHEKECSCCNMLVPICAVWLSLRRNTFSLCLKRLGICKDMRIYIAKMINSVSL
jgi:hypothetical protein